MELIGHVKNYDWGKLGKDSLVAQLMVANGLTEKIEDDVPYAELWMGVHPNGQSIVKRSGQPISSILDENLSFLFKVLSVRKPLSIQVHPNKVSELLQLSWKLHLIWYYFWSTFV